MSQIKLKNRLSKAIVLNVVLLFVGMNIFSMTGSTMKDTSVSPINSETTIGDIPILRSDGPGGTFEDYKNSRENKLFTIQTVKESTCGKDNPMIIVFINTDLMPDIEDEITVYNSTLVQIGYNTVILEVDGGTVEDIKSQILNYWGGGYNVTGTVLIGDLPVAWYHHENDFDVDGDGYADPAEFPCDLFLMDLDGQWIDSDADGMYDQHIDSVGDTAPEIFIGRIDASDIPGDEITTIEKYLQKVNDFWMGNIPHTDFGLTYTDMDWAGYPYHRWDIQYAYDNYDAIWYPAVSRDDYVSNRLSNTTYEFIQISTHAGGGSGGHNFENGGYLLSDDVRQTPPRALFYNLFTCSSLRFTDYNCLGNGYILDTASPSLSVVGSTKIGSMLEFRRFYEPIGQNYSFGKSFQKWFEYVYPYSDYPDGYNEVSWYYGMTILGDPTLIPAAVIDDVTPPVTTCELDGEMQGDDYISDVTVILTATDPVSGVNYTMIKIDEGEYEEYIDPVVVSGLGDHTVYFYSVDFAENVEEEKNCTFTIVEPTPLAALQITEITGGMGVTVTIKNVGNASYPPGPAINLEWNIKVTGGFLGLVDADVDGNKSSLAVNTTEDAASGSLGFFHLGPLEIEVTADADNAAKVTEKATAFIIGPFVLSVQMEE